MLVTLLLLALLPLPTVTEKGTLRVKTDVVEVEVFVDAVSVGTTPLTLTTVEAGAHHIRLAKPGFADQEQEVQIQPGGTTKVFIIMKANATEAPKLPARFHVVHQHAVGACSGILTVTADAIDYRSRDGREVFHIPMAEVRSVSRSMGPAWWTSAPLNTPSQYSACRLDTPGRSYGFFAYEEDPKLESTPAESRIRYQDISPDTKKLFDLLYRLWEEALERKRHPTQAGK